MSHIEELRSRIQEYQKTLRKKDGQAVLYSESGPPSMELVNLLFHALSELDARVQELDNLTFRALSDLDKKVQGGAGENS